MAFVFRAEKVSSLSPKKDEADIGPGQYIAQTEHKQIKGHKAPFMVSSYRDDKISKTRDLPGPGAYYHDETFEKYYKNLQKSKFEQEGISMNVKALKNLPVNVNTSLEAIEGVVLRKNVEHLGFLTRDKRFKEGSKENETPGPGFYVREKKKETKHPVIKDLGQSLEKADKVLKKVFKSDINDNNKVVSIPFKHQSYGYDVDEEGKIIMNEDPEKYKRFKGEKNDTVGPGNYDINKPSDWSKKGTQWSKSKTPKVFFGEEGQKNNTETEKMSLKVQLSRSYDGGSDKGKNRIDVQNKNNFRKLQSKSNFRALKNMMSSEAPDLLENFQKQISRENPGPGYYYDDKSMSSFRPARYPESRQNFQSNLQRFKSTSGNESVGPGTYFQDDTKIYTDSKMKNMRQKFLIPLSTKNQQQMQKTHQVFSSREAYHTPGPGQYEANNEFSKRKTFSNKFHFGSTEKRFVEFSKQIKSTTPGPGSYIDSHSTAVSTQYKTQEKWLQMKTGDYLKAMKKKIKDAVSVGSENNSNSNRPQGEKEIVPPVGTYDPDKIFTIDYKIKKNTSKPSMVEAAFNSTISKKRFDINKDNDDIGPGYYHKEKKPQTAQLYPPFKLSESRFKQNKVDTNVAPGTYNQSSYFDWNRKTFNILYL